MSGVNRKLHINYAMAACCLFFCISLSAQIVTAEFTMQDTTCINTPFNITNLSKNASTYFWTFCEADISTPITTNLGNVGGKLGTPAFTDYISDNGKYYGFLINNSPGGLVRLEYGNSLNNVPVATDLGNFNGIIPNGAQGVQIVKSNGLWYAIITGGDPAASSTPRVIKIEFGSNLANNTPVATNWGNIGNLAYPHELYMFQENSNWYGITVNYRSSTLTRFNFGTNFNSPPTGSNLGNVGGLSGPTGLHPVNDHGTWHFFIANFDNNTYSRIDFGNSILNPPTTSLNLGNPGGLAHPRDISIINYCGQSIAFIVNDDATILELSFPTLTSTPFKVPLAKVVTASNIHSISKIYREGNDLYAFLPNSYANTLTRIKFPGCSQANMIGSTLQAPPPIEFRVPGIMKISLIVDDGLPTQAVFCKHITVTGFLDPKLPADTSVCLLDSLQLNGKNVRNIQWTPVTGLSSAVIPNPKASPAATTTYTASFMDINTCLQRSFIIVRVDPLPVVSVSVSGSIGCAADTVQLFASGGSAYKWSPATGLNDITISDPLLNGITQNTAYTVAVTSADGCVASDSVTVLLTPNSVTRPYLMPNAFTPNKDGLNDCFGIKYWGTLRWVEFSVFTRAGQAIFTTNDPKRCWDGTYKSIQQPAGTYVYQIKAGLACSDIERAGTFLLIR